MYHRYFARNEHVQALVRAYVREFTGGGVGDVLQYTERPGENADAGLSNSSLYNGMNTPYRFVFLFIKDYLAHY